MERYANNSGNSGVDAFEIGGTYILVRFNTGRIYEYTYASAGSSNIETMKSLARSGKGLSTFISRYVKDKYSRII